MVKWLKNNKGFTLVEMMLVLVIIAVLVIITVPNVFKYSSTVDERGCEAYHKMVMGAAEAYKLETNERPKSLQELADKGYLPKGEAEKVEECPGGQKLTIANGEVKIVEK